MRCTMCHNATQCVRSTCALMGRLLKSHVKMRRKLEPVAWTMRRREQLDQILMHNNDFLKTSAKHTLRSCCMRWARRVLLALLCAANIGESLPSLQPLSTELRRALRRPATYRRTLDDQLERMKYKHPNRPHLSLCQSESDSAGKVRKQAACTTSSAHLKFSTAYEGLRTDAVITKASCSRTSARSAFTLP